MRMTSKQGQQSDFAYAIPAKNHCGVHVEVVEVEVADTLRLGLHTGSCTRPSEVKNVTDCRGSKIVLEQALVVLCCNDSHTCSY